MPEHRKQRLMIVAVVVAVHLTAAAAWPQSRRLNRIAPAAAEGAAFDIAEIPADMLPALPERDECEATVRLAAAAYGDASLGDLLAEDMPQRDELLDALQRAGQRVSNLQMRVDSVDNVRILDWHGAAKSEIEGRLDYTLTSECIASVRVVLSFDGSTSGQRAVTESRQGEWRIRFTQTVSVAGGGR